VVPDVFRSVHGPWNAGESACTVFTAWVYYWDVEHFMMVAAVMLIGVIGAIILLLLFEGWE
jgi:hypothetical protein